MRAYKTAWGEEDKRVQDTLSTEKRKEERIELLFVSRSEGLEEAQAGSVVDPQSKVSGAIL